MTSLELQKFRETISDFRSHDYLPTLTHILQTAITITSADKGNIQTLDPLSRTLRIVVQEGFEETLSPILCRGKSSGSSLWDSFKTA